MNTKTWLCCMTEFSDIDKLKWSFNMPCKSLKGILVLFKEEEEKPYTRHPAAALGMIFIHHACPHFL